MTHIPPLSAPVHGVAAIWLHGVLKTRIPEVQRGNYPEPVKHAIVIMAAQVEEAARAAVAARPALVETALETPPEFTGGMTTVEAAEALGTTARTVQRWCEAGLLEHRMAGRQYRIDPASVAARTIRHPDETNLAA
ncbi:helix-turn-helix domain-containing protein [Brevibacterium moorei]|uniref:helix-turn-helix domain-containing protein n=1 Tax=Brevibacterium moorei TaxID=2968457 RepID=UPI00211C43A6|nr:helix-turn-helix domain-containing protein [Brevibacterium sp. 68QC2CO]MCQ9386807.1 helix-turn-helix domain-containing protein [Brevibacterium sp. 68QC2CO]